MRKKEVHSCANAAATVKRGICMAKEVAELMLGLEAGCSRAASSLALNTRHMSAAL